MTQPFRWKIQGGREEIEMGLSQLKKQPNHPSPTLTQLICGVLKCLNCGSSKINQGLFGW